jgi:hypothetical protein
VTIKGQCGGHGLSGRLRSSGHFGKQRQRTQIFRAKSGQRAMALHGENSRRRGGSIRDAIRHNLPIRMFVWFALFYVRSCKKTISTSSFSTSYHICFKIPRWRFYSFVSWTLSGLKITPVPRNLCGAYHHTVPRPHAAPVQGLSSRSILVVV